MRVIDSTKIERIKTETKILIVEKGYHGASIAEIAKRANVSDGYLYRHYKNKSELVKDILETQLKQFHDYIFGLLDDKNLISEIVEGIVLFLSKLTEEEPHALTFAHMLVYDHDFEYPKSRYEAINKLSEEILVFGKRTGEFAQEIREIDVLLTILTIPVKFIEYSKKGYHHDTLIDEEEQKRLVNLCMKALK